MTSMLINATQPDEVRVAVVDNGHLRDLDIERPDSKQKKANIYKGIISSIEPSLGAVFVSYGAERHGFLPLKEISREYFIDPNTALSDHVDIHKVLRIGQELVVQVEKEERGTKGAALTTFISLAGSYLVLMPNNPRAGGISRRIDGEERDELKELVNQLNLPEGMGLIIRTAGVSKDKEELEWDLRVLLHYWDGIKQAAIAKPGPYLIHEESDVITRAIRDYLRQDIHEIIVDEQKAFEQAKKYLEQVRPDFAGRVKLYTESMPLLSRYHVEQQIEDTFQREVRLPSGGSIVIDQTEALVSIDINSSRATRGKSIEETAFNTNLEAADEIARQLRLRDIGGLIVIDFIDMTPTRNQREVETRLRNALKMDRARVQIGRISRFGLLEMSRQRLRSSQTKANQSTCPRCEGKGTIRGVESLALTVLHMLQEMATEGQTQEFQVQLPIPMATYMMNEKRDSLAELEKRANVTITLIPNIHLETPHYSVKQIKRGANLFVESSLRTIPTYELVEEVQEAAAIKPTAVQVNVEPAINAFLSEESTLNVRPRRASWVKRLIRKLVASIAKKKTTRQEDSSQEQPYSQGYRGGKHPHHRHRHSRGHHHRDRENGGGRNPRFERSDRSDRSERMDRPPRPERMDRPERTDRPEHMHRSDRNDRPERTDRSDRHERSDRFDRSGRHDNRRPQRPPYPEDRSQTHGPEKPPTSETQAPVTARPIIEKPVIERPILEKPVVIEKPLPPKEEAPKPPVQPWKKPAPIHAPAQDTANKQDDPDK